MQVCPEVCCTWIAGNAGPKKSPPGHHPPQLCRAISLQLRHISTIGKNLLSSNISSTCPYNMVNFVVLEAEIVSLVWGTPANFNGFRARHSSIGRQPKFAPSTEAPPVFGRAANHVGHWSTFLVSTIFQSLCIWNIRINVKICIKISFHYCTRLQSRSKL